MIFQILKGVFTGSQKHLPVILSPLASLNFKGYRSEQSISSATYKVLSTLVYRNYVLTGLNTIPLSSAFLNNVKADLDIARQAGVKLIPRFSYTVSPHTGTCPEGTICPPYGDASKAVVLNHIVQLKPVLTENADVIACVQLGFIGIWGENYYTDYFGDASPNGRPGENCLITIGKTGSMCCRRC